MAPTPPKLGPNRSGAPKPGGSAGAPVAPKLGPNGKGDKKVRGVLGPVDRVIDTASKGVAGFLMNAISAPQQVAFKGLQGIGDAARGDYGAASKGLLGGLGEVVTVGQAGGDLDFASALGRRDPETGERVAAKLPTGVNTFANIVADPLNFVTFGSGAGAKAALKTAETTLAEDAVKRLTTQGVKGLTAAEKKKLRDEIVLRAHDAGARKPGKTADRQLRELALRGRGGVTVRVPGASRIPGVRGGFTAMSGETAAKVGEKTGLTAARDAAKTSKVGKTVRAALVPGARPAEAVGARASNELLNALDAKGAAETSRVDDIITRWNAAVDDFEANAPKGVKFGEEQDRIVTAALESGDIAAAKAANPELARLIDTGDALRRETFEANVKAGTLTDDISRDQESYMHRVQTDEAAKALRDEPQGPLYEGRGLSKSMSPGSTKSRSVAPDSTQAEINEAVRLIQAGEDVPDDLLRDAARVEEYQAPIRQKIDELEAQKDEILTRNLEAQPGELTAAQQRRLAADAEAVRRLDRQISREAARLEQVGAAGERARGAVESAGDTRLGRIVGEGREQMERAGQLDTGLAARRRQADLKARRLEKSAAKAKRPETVAVRTDAAQDARAAANELKGVQRARTTKEVARDINRRAGTSEAVRRGQSDTAAQLTGAEARRQETALQRAVRERDAAASAAGTRADRYKNQAAARAVRNDEKALAKIQERVESLTDQLAEKSKLADDDTRELVESIAQKLPPGAKLYRESAVASLIESGVEAARAVETAQLVNRVRGITDEAGVPILHSADDLKSLGIEPTKEGLKAVGLVEFELPKLGKFYASPAVKDEMTKFSTVVEDDIVGKTKKALTTWDRWWKGQVTAALPGGIPFASRNARTNVMLTVLDGMNPKWFADGGAFQLRVRNVIKKNAAELADNGVEATMKAHLGERDFEIWKAAREHGVIGDGFYNIDLSDAPELRAAGMKQGGSKLRKGVRFAAGSKGTLAVKGRALNSAVEQHARMSHFLYSIDRLGDLGEAAARTNTVLFDYGRVTPFEQKILKKVLPFWTFMRKNLPGQVRAFVENPIRVTAPEKLSQATSDPVGEDAPEYQQRRGDRIQRLGPLAGLITTPERPLQAAASSLEPLAQLAGAALPGSQGAIEPEGGLPQAFRSMVSQVGGGPAAAGKALIEEGTGKSSFTGFNLNPDEMRQRLLTTALPQLGRAPSLSGRLPDAVVPRSTKDKAKLKTLAQVAALLGLKVEFPAE